MIPKFTQSTDQKYYRSIADVFSATVIKAADDAGQWIVQPHVIELNGDDAPEMPALAGDAIKPAVDNVVLCVTSRNNYEHVLQNRANRSTGANLIIVAVFSDELTRDAILNVTRTLNVGGDFNLTGKATLGAGTQKMVLGESLQTTIEAMIAALNALYAWGATGVAPGPTGGIAPFPGTPPVPTWDSATLSANHKLD